MLRTHYIADAPLNTPVTLAGWIHEIRELGALTFLVLRDRSGLIQVTVKTKDSTPELLATVKSLVKEDAVAVKCTLKESKMVKLGGGKEAYPTAMTILGKVEGTVPFEVTGKVPVDLDVRLDNRVIDLRRLETSAVFKIRHWVQRAFREKALELGGQEINPPCIAGSSTEGGTDVFTVKYFEKDAMLVQSPQLYKQMAVMGGMDKVFMITPVFRAEKHNTTQHLNEITQMDMEIGFAGPEDALDYLEAVFCNIIHSVRTHCAKELEILGVTVNPVEKIPRVTYTHALELLNKDGKHPLKWGQDLTRDHEKAVCDLLASEAVIIKDYPTAIRAFYSMPYPDMPEMCTGYDLIYRGVEMASGAQRIHIPALLEKQLRSRDLDPASFKGYIDAFRYGGVPHAGWSIGSERLTQQLTGVANIRETALFPRDRHRITP
jgi:aspartyl-tRNA synthetase